MIQIRSFTFNPFQENTYVIYNDTKDAIIVDPGMYDRSEQAELVEFLEQNGLKLVKLLNTHTHIDHVFGNKFIYDQYGLKPYLHKDDQVIYSAAGRSAELYGLNYEPLEQIEAYLEEGDTIELGEDQLNCILIPGHSPGHLVFVSEKQNFMIGGDVLFRGSIGRTDLPGGNHHHLIDNIQEKIFTLDEGMIVYPGHGDPTTVGFEKANNPFF